jgi:hypothetical protein
VKSGARVATETFGRSEGSISVIGFQAGEAEAARGELVDPAQRTEHGGDRRLALAVLPHVAYEFGQFVGRETLQPPLPVARAQVLFDGAAVPRLRRRTKVKHGPSQPQVGGLPQPQSRVWRDRFAAAPPGEQVVAQLPGRHDAAVDGAPALNAGGVLEADLQHAGGPAVDVPFDSNSARGIVRIRSSDSPQPVPLGSGCAAPLVELVAIEVELAPGPGEVLRKPQGRGCLAPN